MARRRGATVVTAGIRFLILAAGSLVAASALADVDARVDRNRVELNESFTLTVSIDTNTDAQPDTRALEENFFLVSPRRDMSNTSIVNGQIRRSNSWSWQLMAKRAGELEIPAITVGGESSQPMMINVIEPTYQPPGEADVFITSEVDTGETYVQAQVLYRIKTYRAVATRQPTLRDPTFDGAEVLIEGVGESNYDAVLGGKAYSVNERVFALFPQESGDINISPARFEARVLRDGRITGRKVFTSQPQSISVKPIPTPPAEFANAVWLPAQDVTLSENWSEPPQDLVAGEPVTRSITITALGQLETQIPVIEPPESQSVNVYADKPELSREIESAGIRGVREDQYALIGVDPGRVTLPDLELPWFNLGTGEWQVARLPGREFDVLPADDVFAAVPEAVTEVAAPATVNVVESPFWRMIAQFLGAAWALTMLAWWWSSRPTRDEKAPEPPPIYKQQSALLKDARSAAKSGDAARVKSAMLEWARLEWPNNAPRSIGDIATRVHDPLAAELNALSRSRYAPGDNAWDGLALAKALRALRVIKADSRGDGGELLPPLMPSQ
ncbi:MAG: BatD family protein [Pseudomonadota bacterium]